MEAPKVPAPQQRLLKIQIPMHANVKEAIIRAAEKDGQEDASAWVVAELVKILKRRKLL